MLSVSLLDFLATGRLGPVQLGARRGEVARALGAPDDRDARARSNETAEIWRYGDVELHFDGRRPDASVWLICADAFCYRDRAPTPEGGPQIRLDPWIVAGGLREDTAAAELARAGVGFTSGPYRLSPDTLELRTAAGVSLLFSAEPEGDGARHRTLHAIEATRR